VVSKSGAAVRRVGGLEAVGSEPTAERARRDRMSFSITIAGHAANPDEEREIRNMVRTLVENIRDPEVVGGEVKVAAAAFSGSYGAEDFLAGSEPMAPVGPGEFEDGDAEA
jgi:hypothetical protein